MKSLKKCLRCNKEIFKTSDFCSESCRRNYRYHNVSGVKEKDKEYHKKYIIDWRDKNSTYYSDWCAKNKDRLASYSKKWSKENKQKIIAWCAKNKERRKEYKNRSKLKVLKEHPEKVRAWKLDYKLRGDKCEHCGVRDKLEFHHFDYDNHEGITLCQPCHRQLHKLLKGGFII